MAFRTWKEIREGVGVGEGTGKAWYQRQKKGGSRNPFRSGQAYGGKTLPPPQSGTGYGSASTAGHSKATARRMAFTGGKGAKRTGGF